MRAIGIGLLFFTTLGGGIMGDAAIADDKKEKEFPALPKKGFEFNEKVTVKWWSAEGKKFNAEKQGVDAFRFTGGKSQKSFFLKTKDVGGVLIAPGSEVIDSDGNTYVVTDSPQTSEDRLVRVKLKPKP